MKAVDRPVLRFEGIEIDPAQGYFKIDGQELYLRQKLLQLLVYLVERRDRVVTKQELIENIWEGASITDDALVQSIKELRRSLGDDSRQPRFIKTIPKVGYRFIAPVEEISLNAIVTSRIEERISVEVEDDKSTNETERHGERETRRDPNTAPLAPRISLSAHLRVAVIVGVMTLIVGVLAIYLVTKSRQLAEVTLAQTPGKRPVAVMYFNNQSGSSDLDWLREGLTDMLITNFSRSPSLTVLSRGQLHLLLERVGHQPGSSIHLDEALEIARRSRAEVMVLGSFAKLDEKVRIAVQLHDGRTGRLLTAESLTADRPGHILNQIDLLALKLATHLGAAPADQAASKSLADVMTHNLEAYRYYSLALEKAQGLHHAEAIALLEKAVVLDPQFAMAHARVGYVYAVTWGLAEQGKPHLEKAFQLSGRLTEKDRLYITAWYAIAHLDYPAAAQTLRQVIAHYPLEIEAYWRLGRLLLGEEQYEEAVEVLKRGLVVDAEAKDVYNALGVTYRDMGRPDEAIAMSERYVRLAPDEPNAHDSLALAYQGAGLYEKALAAYQRALELNPKFEVALLHLGNLHFQLGRYGEALRHYQRYIAMASSDWDRAWGHGRMAWVYWRKGDLRPAAAAARHELSYEKSSVGSSLMIALAGGDQKTARTLEEQLFVKGPYTERGLRPALRNLYFFQGYLGLKRGRAAQAIQNFKEVLKHRPLFWDIDSFEDCLANAYLELGQLDEAIAEYERILKINPYYPLAHYHLGQAYERKGESVRARNAYQRFLQIWKDADADIPQVLDAKRQLAKES